VRLISKQAFRDYMKFRRMTNEQLAEAAQCSTATVAFLRSKGRSARNSVSAEVASRIEEALNAPPGSLFAASVVVGSPSTKGSAA
jgi:transcriptional regulator with XRE-family HTH domain